MTDISKISIKFKSIQLYHFIALGIIFCSSSVLAGQNFYGIDFMTENYPPYNYIEDETKKGLFIDVLIEISIRMGTPITKDDIQLLPWARGYRSILNNEKKCLFGMAKSQERAPLFK